MGHPSIASTLSELNKKIYGTIEAWRNRPIESEHPYVYLDGIVLKRSWAGEVRNVSLLVAIGVNSEGYREILGICEGAKEDKAGWRQRHRSLPECGLSKFPDLGLATLRRCIGTAISSVTCPRPWCGRSWPCLRRSMPARTSRRHGRRLLNGSRGDVDLLRLSEGALAAYSHK